MFMEPLCGLNGCRMGAEVERTSGLMGSRLYTNPMARSCVFHRGSHTCGELQGVLVEGCPFRVRRGLGVS